MVSDVQLDPQKIRTFLVSDVRLYRESVQSALGRRESILVVGTASSMDEAVDRVAALDPAVIVVDMATRDSLCGVRALAAAAPAGKIVAFAVDEQASDIPSYAEAGVASYLPCDASIDDLAVAIEAVTRGEVRCPPIVAGALFRRLAILAPARRDTPVLSRREQEVLALIRNGLCNKEIAQRLTIELPTVKNHVHSLLTKLQVTTRVEAATLDRRVAVRSRVAGIQ